MIVNTMWYKKTAYVTSSSKADSYILDTTGEGAKIITFGEPGFGCTYAFRSEDHTDDPYRVERTRGEKVIFFIEKLDAEYINEVEEDWSVL